MPQTNVLPDWRATYPNDAKAQKPGGYAGTITRTASGSAWAAGTVTLTVPAVPDYVGTVVPITVSGFLPAGYNGTYQGTIASATTITYPLTSNPGASTQQGTVSYPGCIPLTIATTATAPRVPNKPTYTAGTVQSFEAFLAEVAAYDEARAHEAEAVEAEDVEEEHEEVEEDDGNGGTVKRRRSRRR